MTYPVNEVEGACTCQDQPRAPQGRCKHRLAVALLVMALTKEQHSREKTAVATDRVAAALGLAHSRA